jgi:hypothetical protein
LLPLLPSVKPAFSWCSAAADLRLRVPPPRLCDLVWDTKEDNNRSSKHSADAGITPFEYFIRPPKMTGQTGFEQEVTEATEESIEFSVASVTSC